MDRPKKQIYLKSVDWIWDKNTCTTIKLYFAYMLNLFQNHFSSLFYYFNIGQLCSLCSNPWQKESRAANGDKGQAMVSESVQHRRKSWGMRGYNQLISPQYLTRGMAYVIPPPPMLSRPTVCMMLKCRNFDVDTFWLFF